MSGWRNGCARTFYVRGTAVTLTFVPGWWGVYVARYEMHSGGRMLGHAFRFTLGPLGVLLRPRARRPGGR